MKKKNNSVKAHYKVHANFTNPYTIKILNSSNYNNYQYFMLREKLDNVKKSDKNQTIILGHKVRFPPKGKIILIDGIKHKIVEIEEATFREKNILKRCTLKYKVWLAIKYLQKYA